MSSQTEFYVALLIYGIPVVLAVMGFVVGGFLERSHFKSIREREQQFLNFPAVPTSALEPSLAVLDAQLVTASVVVSLDYFKRILASFRNVFGGRVRSYESLLDRAKREAILRMKEQFPDSHIIVNMRINTSRIGSTHGGNKGLGAVEVLASGTVVKYQM
jgi:uncharacterized protein YbjQ (UPF0145 family)